MNRAIFFELKRHIPFTVFGAMTGIAVMLLFYKMPQKEAYSTFYILHPLHVVLSALVTAAMYKNYKCNIDSRGCSILALLIVGFVGSVGVATLSDSILPYAGELLLGMPHAEPHIGFIEEGKIVIPLAGLGILIAYFRPATTFPHAAHIFVSTWASLFHIIMAMEKTITPFLLITVFVFLFIAVWVPCCFSDIVFPLLFVNKPESK